MWPAPQWQLCNQRRDGVSWGTCAEAWPFTSSCTCKEPVYHAQFRPTRGIVATFESHNWHSTTQRLTPHGLRLQTSSPVAMLISLCPNLPVFSALHLGGGSRVLILQQFQTMPDKTQNELVTIGIHRTPQEFVQEGLSVGHPADVNALFPGCI